MKTLLEAELSDLVDQYYSAMVSSDRKRRGRGSSVTWDQERL